MLESYIIVRKKLKVERIFTGEMSPNSRYGSSDLQEKYETYIGEVRPLGAF